MYGDQKMNMETAQSLGIGQKVDFVSLSYDDLWNAIQDVINNKKYALYKQFIFIADIQLPS